MPRKSSEEMLGAVDTLGLALCGHTWSPNERAAYEMLVRYFNAEIKADAES